MSVLSNITEPVLLLDETKCKCNIHKMVQKAKRNNVKLRPHFKTHQSKAVGEWFFELGVSTITVSSLKMATYFAEAGWKDITVAFPVNFLEIDRIERLAKKITLNIIVEDVYTVTQLSSLLHYPVNAFIKIDIGYHRTGIDGKDTETIDAVLAALDDADKIKFKGFLGHAGHSYNCRSNDEIKKIHAESLQVMKALLEKYSAAYPQLEISVGDTPTCSVCEDFSPATEIRPGNFVFYDLTQNKITSNTKDEIAVALACPVVAKHKDRNEIILYGGGVHFSKDFLDLGNGKRSYGELVWVQEKDWIAPVDGCYMSKLSQEHGTLKVTNEVFDKIMIGDVVAVLPVHSCMTANLMGGFTTLEGKRLDYMDYRKEYLVD